jgi:hypothetical protein
MIEEDNEEDNNRQGNKDAYNKRITVIPPFLFTYYRFLFFITTHWSLSFCSLNPGLRQ